MGTEMLQHQNYWLVCASVKADDSSGHPVTLIEVDRSTSMVKARVKYVTKIITQEHQPLKKGFNCSHIAQ